MILTGKEFGALYRLVKNEYGILDGFRAYELGVKSYYAGNFGKSVEVFIENELAVTVLGTGVDLYIDGPWWDYLREQIPLLQAKANEIRREQKEREAAKEEAKKQRKLAEHEELAKRFKEVMKP